MSHARAARLDPSWGGDEDYWWNHSTLRDVESLGFRAPSGADDAYLTAAEWVLQPFEEPLRLFERRCCARVSDRGMMRLSENLGVGIVDGARLWIPKWKSLTPPVTMDDIRELGWAICSERRSRYEVVIDFFEEVVDCDVPSLASANHGLRMVLPKVISFCERQSGWQRWSDIFNEARAQLLSDDPIIPGNPDLLPVNGYTLLARQTLAAAVSCNVFGGNGSWSDMNFRNTDVQREFEALRARLGAVHLRGMMAAVNEGCGPRS